MTRDQTAILMLLGAAGVAVYVANRRSGTMIPPPPPPPRNTGIQGIVTLGPISPVARPGVPNVRPFPGVLISVYTGAYFGAAPPPPQIPIAPIAPIASAYSAMNGRYGIALNPGTYQVGASLQSPGAVPGGVMAAPPPQTVTVVAGQLLTVNFAFDTGIR